MRNHSSSFRYSIWTFRTILQLGVCLGILGVGLFAQSQPARLSAANPKNALSAQISLPTSTGTPSATARLVSSADLQKGGTPTSINRQPSQAPSPVVIGRSPRAFSVDANTVALYHLDSQAGTSVQDATGNYPGTLYGNATIVGSGLFGGAVSLDGRSGPGSYIRLGHLGNLVSGTVEAYVDFLHACDNINEWFTILSAGGEFGSGDTRLTLATYQGLGFGIYANGEWQWANTGINPCRYLAGGNTEPYFWPSGYHTRWPYEVWRYHHVAGTWGPRGVEVWVDGVLHGVNFHRPEFVFTETLHSEYMCNPQAQIEPANTFYPYCRKPQMGLVPLEYAGGIPPYSTFLIGCDSSTATSCFRGRIDEVRISNIQRTYTVDVIPPSTATPTRTPENTSGEYRVDSKTFGLYHLNATGEWNSVKNEVTQSWNGSLRGSAAIVPEGHFNSGVRLDGNLAYVRADPLSIPFAGAVEAWLNPDQTTAPYMIVSNSSEPQSGIYSWGFFLGMESPGTIQLIIQSNDTRYRADSGVHYSALTGCWHHVAGTWGARGMEIWIDGVLRGTNVFTGYPQINNRYLFGCDGWSRCFKGRIDEVRVSDIQRRFAPPSAPMRPRVLPGGGTLTFFPLIQVAPASACPYG